jgi:deoxyribonuclease-4
MFLGAHVSTSGGVDKAPANGARIGCEAIQVFTKNQRQWKAKSLSKPEIENYRGEIEKSPIQLAVSHDSYLINLASPEDNILKRSREAFDDEVERCEQLGVPYLIFHPGSHVGSGEKVGLKQIAENINDTLDKKPRYKTQLLLETTAGQGTNLGYRFEQLAEILEFIKEKDRVGICVDSCHIFAAGYEIRTADAYRSTLKQLEEVIGLRKLRAFHLNDSKTPLGSRVDRHEHIGQGHIGIEAFRLIVNDERFQGLPMVIETPGEEEDFVRNLKVLKKLRTSSG